MQSLRTALVGLAAFALLASASFAAPAPEAPKPGGPKVGTLEADVALDILNVIMDAPWRVWLRPDKPHYVPISIFFPETKEDWRHVTVLEVSLADGDAPGQPLLYSDSAAKGAQVSGPTASGLSGEGLKLMNGFGQVSTDLELVSATEPPHGPNAPWQICEVNDANRGWHTILILPIPDEVAARGHSRIHVIPSVKYRHTDNGASSEHVVRRKLEIELDPEPWPAFDGWRSYDTHVHTIAEFCSELTYKALRKNYGGPMQMLFESAYALGFIDSPDAARDRLITTDHNNYYSDRDFPRYGPTADGITPGSIVLKHPEYSHYFIDLKGRLIEEGQKEFENYNDMIGITRGEELSLAKSPGTVGWLIGSLSAHMLLFSTRNFVGPFHGGGFLFWKDEANPNRLDWVLGQITHDPNFPLGFAYAAHPFTKSWLAKRFDTVWQDDHFDIALKGDYIRKVDGVERDFIFKGFELWNERNTREVELTIAEAPRIRSYLEDPTRDPRWTAGVPNWDYELQYGLSRWHEYVSQGLSSSSPGHDDVRFVRKLFICAGSDAHGDFNRRSDVAGRGFASMPSILLKLFKFFWMTDNAFGRVRTMVDPTGVKDTLAHNDQERSLLAFSHGQAIATDGPVLDFALDSDGHFDAAKLAWHDALRYEDDDGKMGGEGALDGGRTMLVADGSSEPMAHFRWKSSPSFGGDLERIEIYKDTPGKPAKLGTIKRNTGKAEVLLPSAFVDPQTPANATGWRETILAKLSGAGPQLGPVSQPSAFSLAGFTPRDDKPPFGFRCYTNPVWALPVHCTSSGAVSGTVIAAGSFSATLRFPISMKAAPVPARLVPVDAAGNASGPGVVLAPLTRATASGWTANPRDGIAAAAYTLVNTTPVELSAAADGHSFVLILESPQDAHGNKLNPVAWRVKL